MEHRRLVTVRDLQGQQHTITIELSRPVRLRFWLASLLVKLAGWLVAADVEELEGCDDD